MMHGALDDLAGSGMLLERSGELAALSELIEDTRDGRGGMVLIEGEAGIGKTALLSMTEERARERGLQVLTARCAAMEQGFAYGAALQLVEPAIAGAGAEERRGLLSGAAALAQPVLSAGAFDEASLSATDASYAALHGLYWLAANLSARQPLLLAVDDLHWIDLPSLRWLSYLARRLDGVPVALGVTTRSDEPPVDLELLTELASNPLCRLLQPRQLSAKAVAQVVGVVLGEPPHDAFCAACASATGGNPFLLRELVNALADDGVAPTREAAALVPEFGPQAVSRHVLARLSRRSPAAVQLARAGAVLGDRTELCLVAQLADLDEGTAAGAAAELQRVGILQRGARPGEHGLAFAHAIVRNAIYHALSAPDRSQWHARAAQLLQSRGAPVEQAAAHLLSTDAVERASATAILRQASRRALRRAAPEAAVAYLRRALQLSPASEERSDLVIALGRAELRTDPHAAAEHLAEGYERIADVGRRAKMSLLLGQALALDNRPLESIQVVQSALEALGSADRQLALRLEAELLYFAIGELATVPLAAERLFKIDPADLGQDTEAERALLALFTIVAVGAGQSQQRAVNLAGRALAGGLLPTAGQHWTSVFVFAVAALICADHLEEAGRYLDEAIVEARRRGSLSVYALTASFRSGVAGRRGNIHEALSYAGDAYEAATLTPLGIAAPYPVAFLVDALVEQRRLDEAQQALDQHGFAGDLSGTWASNMLLHSRGRLRMGQGEYAAALEDFLETGRRQLSWGLPNPAILPWRSGAALAHLALGEHREARRLAAEEVYLARVWGGRRTLGMALRALGLVEGGSTGLARLEAAVAELERSPGRLELARALVDLGVALRKAGQRRAARNALSRGCALAEECGGTAIEQRAVDELAIAGGRSQPLPDSGRYALTPSELRVATLAAGGRTNRDIAQELFVTQRTVEIHLTHAYRKLGIPGRLQLADALREDTTAG